MGDNSGSIEYSEFAAGCINIAGAEMEQHLRAVFNIFVIDKSGFLTREELKHVLTDGPNKPSSVRPKSTALLALSSIQLDAGEAVHRKMPDNPILPDGRSLDQVMDEIDVNHEGKISF